MPPRTITMLASLLLIVGNSYPARWNAQHHTAHTCAGEAPPAAAPLVVQVNNPWQQVNDSAFALGDGSYEAEDVFETLVFDGQLYLGMEADNSLGARLWRTRRGVTVAESQDDWEEIAADGAGNPFGSNQHEQNDHIDSLAAFQGQLYASTANRTGTTSGTLVYRLSDQPIGWTQVITAGFGESSNTNFKAMQVFAGHLCGGTSNDISGTQVWCSLDGTTWTQKNSNGFGESSNQAIWSSYVFNEALYVGVYNPIQTVGRLYRTTTLADVSAWEEVYSGPVSSRYVTLLGALDGHLYIATPTIGGVAVLRSATGSSGSWLRVSTPGLDGSSDNAGILTDGAAIYQQALYMAVSNTQRGVGIWRTTGSIQPNGFVDWEEMGNNGLGDLNNRDAQLIAFNDQLYAWASNYISGQQVRRAFFPPPPEQLYLPLLVSAR